MFLCIIYFALKYLLSVLINVKTRANNSCIMFYVIHRINHHTNLHEEIHFLFFILSYNLHIMAISGIHQMMYTSQPSTLRMQIWIC
jgi:hypothetical protein